MVSKHNDPFYQYSVLILLKNSGLWKHRLREEHNNQKVVEVQYMLCYYFFDNCPYIRTEQEFFYGS